MALCVVLCLLLPVCVWGQDAYQQQVRPLPSGLIESYCGIRRGFFYEVYWINDLISTP